MKLWVLDSNLLFKLVEGTDPVLKPALDALALEADAERATFAVSAVTAQEFLVKPHLHGPDEWHRARQALNAFVVLQFDRAAAEEAAKLERAMSAYASTAATRSVGKREWFRDAAIVGTAIARGAEAIYTHDGPMAKMRPTGVAIRTV